MITREEFLGWQCRIRQIAMREEEGRPSSGMQPAIWLAGGVNLMSQINILLVPGDPDESTDFFRFQVKKSADPKQVVEKGLQYLQSTHFHDAASFRDEMTASFAKGSSHVQALLDAEQCLLHFEQFNQVFNLVCTTRELVPAESGWQATFWHNHMFNPDLPGDITIIGFTPHWDNSTSQ